MDIKDPRISLSLLPANSQNFIFGQHQDEYLDLPAIRTPDGTVISRWSPTREEREAIRRGEDIYITILSGFQCPVCQTANHKINPFYATVGVVDWSK